MEDRKMEIISQLMEELQELMQPSSEELGERLGREPKVASVEVEAGPIDEVGEGEEIEMEGPEEKLKQRIMKLRA